MPVQRLNGTEIFYREVGAGLPCLVMHGGLGMDHTYLHPWLDPLGDRLHLVYYDHRGNGRSGRPPLETLNFPQFCADADALRAHLGRERIALLGHSYGGFIALEYALRYPERIARLILVSTAPAMDPADPGTWARLRRAGASERQARTFQGPIPPDDAGFRRWQKIVAPLYYGTFSVDLAARAFARTIWSGSAAARSRELLRQYNVTDRLGDVRAPALVLVGARDLITPPSEAARLAAGIPRARQVTLERSGHFPHVEEPQALEAAVRAWLAESATGQ